MCSLYIAHSHNQSFTVRSITEVRRAMGKAFKPTNCEICLKAENPNKQNGHRLEVKNMNNAHRYELFRLTQHFTVAFKCHMF